MLKNKGFIFIETIIVICVLTISLMSLYANYSKIMTNTQELNTFDTAEYNYKTYFLKKIYLGLGTLSNDTCTTYQNSFSDNGTIKICLFNGVVSSNNSVEEYINKHKDKMDAYIIDYLLKQDLTENNDNLFIAEFKKEDKQNSGEYFTYISSLNY